MNLHYHHMTNHRQQAPQPQRILPHSTTHQNQYHSYQLNLIQNQVHHIIIWCIHLNHWTPSILNKDNTRIKNVREIRNNDPIKKCTNITAKLIKAEYNSNVTQFKLDKDTIQLCVYFLSLMNYFNVFITIDVELHDAYGLSIHKRGGFNRIC